MKNMFEEEKKFDSRNMIFWKIVPTWVYFGQGEDFKLATELCEKVQYSRQPGNQKRLKWSNTAYVNKWSFIFKTKLCAFQESKI